MTTRTVEDRRHWLVGRAEPDQTALLCLPHSGGGTTWYRLWRQLAPTWLKVVPVNLPGRESRLADPPLHDGGEVVRALLPHVEREMPSRYAIFGHSMGALLGFELSRLLAARGRPPAHLFVSGCPAPDARGRMGRLSDKPIEEILAALMPLGGTDVAALDHPELIELLEPALRADLAVAEGYIYRPGPPLPCPISVLLGDGDPLTVGHDVTGWGAQTAAGLRLFHYPGDHAFPRDQDGPVVRDITGVLAAGTEG
jgi:surfactin synthase thioesterase subunit